MTNPSDFFAELASQQKALEAELKQLKKENERLERENELYRKSHLEHLHLDPSQSVYHQMRATQPMGKLIAEHRELEERAQANGYRSLRFLVYGSEKTIRFAHIPNWLRTPPTHWLSTDHYEKETVWAGSKRVERNRFIKGVTGPKAQKQLEKLWPIINDLLSDPANDAEDVNQLRALYLSLSYEQFANELYQIKANEAGLKSVEVEVETVETDLTIDEQTALLARLQPNPQQNYVPIHDD